jgi:antitoxin (DNA-binding transcriptional repressor) of toxin-antitoxin stability system
MYIVHMRYVTASEARKNWFQLLDQAANGEVIAIERDGKKLVLKLERAKRRTPSYKGLIDFKDADDADTWGWEWKGPGRLVPKKTRKTKR